MTKLFNIQITLEILVYTLSKHLAWYTHYSSKGFPIVPRMWEGRGGEGGDHDLGDLNMKNKWNKLPSLIGGW